MEKPLYIWSDSLVIDAREISAAILEDDVLTVTLKGNSTPIRFGHPESAKSLMRNILEAAEKLQA